VSLNVTRDGVHISLYREAKDYKVHRSIRSIDRAMSSLMTAEKVKPSLPGGLTVKDDLETAQSHLSASTVLPESRMLDLRRSSPRE